MPSALRCPGTSSGSWVPARLLRGELLQGEAGSTPARSAHHCCSRSGADAFRVNGVRNEHGRGIQVRAAARGAAGRAGGCRSIFGMEPFSGKIENGACPRMAGPSKLRRHLERVVGLEASTLAAQTGTGAGAEPRWRGSPRTSRSSFSPCALCRARREAVRIWRPSTLNGATCEPLVIPRGSTAPAFSV